MVEDAVGKVDQELNRPPQKKRGFEPLKDVYTSLTPEEITASIARGRMALVRTMEECDRNARTGDPASMSHLVE